MPKNNAGGLFFSFCLLINFWFLMGCGLAGQPTSLVSPEDSFLADKDLGSKDGLATQLSLSTNPKDGDSGHKEVALVFVVDTSPNMVQHLQRVPQTFKKFIPSLASLGPWRMMITNADVGSHPPSAEYPAHLLQGKAMSLERQGQVLEHSVLSHQSAEKESIFIQTLQRHKTVGVTNQEGTYINPCERPPFCQGRVRNPISSLMRAFSANPEFFKDTADFVIALIFTNGDNTDNPPDLNNKVLEEFHRVHGPAKQLRVYSIAIIPKDESCLSYDKAHFSPHQFSDSAMAHKVHALVRHTNGKTMNICDSEYTPLALAIARAHAPIRAIAKAHN